MDQEGNPWFIAIDVAKTLGYVKPDDAVRQHCKKSKDFNPRYSRGSGVTTFKFPMIEDSEHPKRRVRVIQGENGEPWFVGREVALILGYKRPADAVRQHCKAAKLLKVGEMPTLELPSRGVLIIPERDLYRLIINSELPEAQEFEEWVVGVVLPTIRKTGGYIHAAPEMSDAEIMARAMKVADSTLERVQKERDKALKANLELARRNVKLFHQTEAMTGPTEFFHELMDTTDSYTFTDVAAMFCAKSLFLGQ